MAFPLTSTDRLISLGFKHMVRANPNSVFRLVLDISDNGKWEGKCSSLPGIVCAELDVCVPLYSGEP